MRVGVVHLSQLEVLVGDKMERALVQPEPDDSLREKRTEEAGERSEHGESEGSITRPWHIHTRHESEEAHQRSPPPPPPQEEASRKEKATPTL